MAPKKKSNKKAQDDDWEAEMGETITPQNGAEEPKAEDAAPAEDAAEGGGLMAALQRRGKKKKNKGADFELEGEDPTADDGAGATFESKAPQEALSMTTMTMSSPATMARRRRARAVRLLRSRRRRKKRRRTMRLG